MWAGAGEEERAGDRVRSPVGPGAWLRVAAVALAVAVPAASLAQDEGLTLLPPLWDDDGLAQGVGGERTGDDEHGEGPDGRLVPGTADAGLVAGEEAPEEDAGQERTAAAAAAQVPQEGSMSAGVKDDGEPARQARPSFLLGYLDDREGAGQVLSEFENEAADGLAWLVDRYITDVEG